MIVGTVVAVEVMVIDMIPTWNNLIDVSKKNCPLLLLLSPLFPPPLWLSSWTPVSAQILACAFLLVMYIKFTKIGRSVCQRCAWTNSPPLLKHRSKCKTICCLDRIRLRGG
eukprot:Lithocolla_globosa_v1_NODE_1386_length_2616_cov_35.702850.p5 type:complete len:111 gc:universal NODE_1386_length_2616_cov_35.702850:1936-2268(+)